MKINIEFPRKLLEVYNDVRALVAPFVGVWIEIHR